MILAIDPGPTESAWVRLCDDGKRIPTFAKSSNRDAMDVISDAVLYRRDIILAIEQVACMGMAVGAEVLETCYESGRMAQAYWEVTGRNPIRVKRHAIKMHFCGSTRANDGNIRQAIIDRFGGKEKAIGKKSAPGPLYGVANDVWQALALALYVHDMQQIGVKL